MDHYYQNIIGLIAVGLGVGAVTLLIIALAFTKGEKPTKAQHYHIDEEWTFGPLLISAVDEPDLGPHFTEPVFDPMQLVGGSAHDKW